MKICTCASVRVRVSSRAGCEYVVKELIKNCLIYVCASLWTKQELLTSAKNDMKKRRVIIAIKEKKSDKSGVKNNPKMMKQERKESEWDKNS